MEGSIKDLDDVKVDRYDGRQDDDDDDDDYDSSSNNSESADQGSRSTWAQVVSGEQGDDQLSSRDTTYQQDEEEENDDDEGETCHKKLHKRLKRIFIDLWRSYKNPTDEQDYCEEVQDDEDMEPSEEELSDYKLACAKLWKLDYNRLTPGEDYEIEVGEGKRVHDTEDMAEDSLFTWVNEEVLRRPTISRFCALLDNYNAYEDFEEVVTEQDKREQAAFIEEISRTAPIKYLYKYLSSTGIFDEDYQEFKRMLIDLWFTLYGRGGTCDNSSAFEHVFVGEIKQRGKEQVSGFHNWLQFYLEEVNGRADYQGYILPRKNDELPDAETQLLTIQFEWNGILKSLSSMFVGVSPEFELALYTLCFLAGEEDNYVEVGPYPVNIKCYRLGDHIGSAFPIAEA